MAKKFNVGDTVCLREEVVQANSGSMQNRRFYEDCRGADGRIRGRVVKVFASSWRNIMLCELKNGSREWLEPDEVEPVEEGEDDEGN